MRSGLIIYCSIQLFQPSARLAPCAAQLAQDLSFVCADRAIHGDDPAPDAHPGQLRGTTHARRTESRDAARLVDGQAKPRVVPFHLCVAKTKIG